MAQDGQTDTVDCTGGGVDAGTVDAAPAEIYIACANGDGDALVDMADACPAQPGTMANGCPVPPPAATQPAQPSAKKCKKGRKLKKGRCVKKRKKRRA